MAHYVVRIARRAGIVLLFVAGHRAGILSGMLFARAATCRRCRRSTTTRRAPSHASTPPTATSSASSPRAPRRHHVRADLAAAAAGHHRGRGQGLRHAYRPQRAADVVTAVTDLVRRAEARREHADAAAGPQPVSHEREDVVTQVQGAAALDRDREALHQARDLHALLQPHALGPRHVWRGSRLASLLRQVGEGPQRSRKRRCWPASSSRPRGRAPT